MGIERIASKLGTAVGTAIGNSQKIAKKAATSAAPTAKQGAKKTLAIMDTMAQSAKAAIAKTNPQEKSIKMIEPPVELAPKPIANPNPGYIPPLSIDPQKSLTKQLAKETLKVESKRLPKYKTVKTEAEMRALAKEARNGAVEVIHATKRQDIPKSARESADFFERQGILPAEQTAKMQELKAELKEKHGSKLLHEKMQELELQGEKTRAENAQKAYSYLDEILAQDNKL